MGRAPIALALAAFSCATTPKTSGGHALAFVEDDYLRARESARARQVPLFVEAWAPW